MNWRSRSELAPNLLRSLDFLLPKRNCGGREGWLPKLVIVRHGHSPMCHGTLRIQLGHILKCILGGAVGERVQQSYTSFELLLHGRCARSRKRYFSQLLRHRVVMRFLRPRERSDQQNDQ